jgi:thiamine-monophosphate kinase
LIENASALNALKALLSFACKSTRAGSNQLGAAQFLCHARTSNTWLTLLDVRRSDEFSLIELFTKGFDVRPPPFGPGDDCAVLPPSSKHTCVTTDSVVENVHFSRAHFSFEDIGHKALAVNLSDLAAMGSVPQWMLCSLQLPTHLTTSQVRQLGKGMAELAALHHIRLVGGNISRAKELSLTLTVAGTASSPILRSGAQVGHTLYVSGTLGRAAAGLRILTSGKKPASTSLIRAQTRPNPHLAVGQLLAPFMSSCIDVSDGLLQDLGHLLKSSRVGASLSSQLIPVCPEVQKTFPKEAFHWAVSGGEDYVLLFSVSPKQHAAFERTCRRKNIQVFAIGECTSAKKLVLDGKTPHSTLGFSHF